MAIDTCDGISLYSQEWRSDQTPRGTVLIVHGLGEHIGRYAYVAQAVARRGWNVAGYDHRGHGRSAGARGDIGKSDLLLSDLAAAIDAFQSGRDLPFVLFGHSMGGVVAGRFVAEGLKAQPAQWYRPVDGLILSSPALKPEMSRIQKVLLAIGELLVPGLGCPNGIKPESLCHDPEVVRAYRSDPLVHDRISARLLRFILASGDEVRKVAGRWELPTLLLYSESDRLAGGSGEFAGAAPATAVTVRHYPHLYHELLNEPERDEILNEIGDWLDKFGQHSQG